MRSGPHSKKYHVVFTCLFSILVYWSLDIKLENVGSFNCSMVLMQCNLWTKLDLTWSLLLNLGRENQTNNRALNSKRTLNHTRNYFNKEFKLVSTNIMYSIKKTCKWGQELCIQLTSATLAHHCVSGWHDNTEWYLYDSPPKHGTSYCKRFSNYKFSSIDYQNSH